MNRKVSRVRPAIRRDAPSDDGANPNLKNMTFVYLLKLSNGDIYKGLTEDLQRRLREHEDGKVASTKNYRPFVLIGYEVYSLKSDAVRREQFLKKSEGVKLLKQQYRDAILS